MKRLKLHLEELQVESFATDDPMLQRGTVRGADSDAWGCSSVDVTFCNEDTCEQTCGQNGTCTPTECCGPDQQDSGGCGTGGYSDVYSCANTRCGCNQSVNNVNTCVSPCTYTCTCHC